MAQVRPQKSKKVPSGRAKHGRPQGQRGVKPPAAGCAAEENGAAPAVAGDAGAVP